MRDAKRKPVDQENSDLSPVDASVVQNQKMAGGAEAAQPLEEAGGSKA